MADEARCSEVRDIAIYDGNTGEIKETGRMSLCQIERELRLLRALPYFGTADSATQMVQMNAGPSLDLTPHLVDRPIFQGQFDKDTIKVGEVATLSGAPRCGSIYVYRDLFLDGYWTELNWGPPQGPDYADFTFSATKAGVWTIQFKTLLWPYQAFERKLTVTEE